MYQQEVLTVQQIDLEIQPISDSITPLAFLSIPEGSPGLISPFHFYHFYQKKEEKKRKITIYRDLCNI